MKNKAFLHLFNEFVPIISFFIASQIYSFYTATSVLMFFTLIALALGWYFEKRLPALPIISGFFVIISGLITVVYHKPDALIFADTLYYLIMGFSIAIGLTLRVNLLKLIFNRVFAMSDTGWKILAVRWLFVFLLGGIANEIVRQVATEDVWVNFKVVKVTLLSIFGLYQFTLIKRYRIVAESTAWGLRK